MSVGLAAKLTPAKRKEEETMQLSPWRKKMMTSRKWKTMLKRSSCCAQKLLASKHRQTTQLRLPKF
eukprot:10133756-Karenia_brevis.AAC.1